MTKNRCVFTDDDVAVLKRAYATTCNALRFAIEFNPDPERADEIRNEIARCVIKTARQGERRPLKIAQLVLAAMPPLQAHWGEERSTQCTDAATVNSAILDRELRADAKSV